MEYLCGIGIIQALCRADTGVPFGVMLAFSRGDKKVGLYRAYIEVYR